jgi:hypothetical protein
MAAAAAIWDPGMGKEEELLAEKVSFSGLRFLDHCLKTTAAAAVQIVGQRLSRCVG